MHVYFGPACFIFHSIERDNEGLVIFFIFYVPLMASVMYFFPLFFFPVWKELVYYTLIMLIPSCTFDQPCVSTRTWRGTEKINGIAGQCQNPKLGLQIPLKGLVLQYRLLLKPHIVPQTTSASAGSGRSRFSLKLLLVLHSPPKTHETSKAQEEGRGIKGSGIISMLMLLKNIYILKAKVVSRSDAVRRVR